MSIDYAFGTTDNEEVLHVSRLESIPLKVFLLRSQSPWTMP